MGRQSKEPLRLLVQFRPNLFTCDHDVLVFVGQPLGPLLNGLLPFGVSRCASGQDSADEGLCS